MSARFVETVKSLTVMLVFASTLFKLTTGYMYLDARTAGLLVLIVFLSVVSYVHHKDITELKENYNVINEMREYWNMTKKGIITLNMAFMVMIAILVILLIYLSASGGSLL